MNREHYCKSPFFHCYLESARAPAKVSTYTMCYFLNIQHFNILPLFLLTTLKTIVIFLVGCLHGFSKSTWISLRTQAKVFPFVKIYISYISGESISVSRNLYFTSESVSLLILKYTCSATSLMRNVPQSQIIVSWNREVVKSSKTFVTHWISIDASEMPKVATMIFLTFNPWVLNSSQILIELFASEVCYLPTARQKGKKKKGKRQKEKKKKRQKDKGNLEDFSWNQVLPWLIWCILRTQLFKDINPPTIDINPTEKLRTAPVLVGPTNTKLF